MSDLPLIDERLSGALLRYADSAVTPRDAMAITRAAHGTAVQPRTLRMAPLLAMVALVLVGAGLTLAVALGRPSTTPGSAPGIDCESSEPSGTGAFQTTGSVAIPRVLHRAVRLGDGRVLVIGGTTDGETALATAEIYDPATARFESTGPMAAGRFSQSTTMLSDGRVLVVGGRPYHAEAGLATAEVYDPSTGTFGPTGPMSHGITLPTATSLADGRVLVLGKGLVEVWDPATGAFLHHGPGPWDSGMTATLLTNGRVLVIGGAPSEDAANLDSAELWDPTTGEVTPAGSLSVGRSGHTATLLADGSVLVVGGEAGGPYRYFRAAPAELWDPTTLSFRPAGDLAAAREGHTSTLLTDGRVLVLGGMDAAGQVIGTAEIWDPSADRFTLSGHLISPRAFHTATLLSDGCVLVVGGEGPSSIYIGSDTLSSAEVWSPRDASTTDASQ